MARKSRAGLFERVSSGDIFSDCEESDDETTLPLELKGRDTSSTFQLATEKVTAVTVREIDSKNDVLSSEQKDSTTYVCRLDQLANNETITLTSNLPNALDSSNSSFLDIYFEERLNIRSAFKSQLCRRVPSGELTRYSDVAMRTRGAKKISLIDLTWEDDDEDVGHKGTRRSVAPVLTEFEMGDGLVGRGYYKHRNKSDGQHGNSGYKNNGGKRNVNTPPGIQKRSNIKYHRDGTEQGKCANKTPITELKGRRSGEPILKIVLSRVPVPSNCLSDQKPMSYRVLLNAGESSSNEAAPNIIESNVRFPDAKNGCSKQHTQSLVTSEKSLKPEHYQNSHNTGPPDKGDDNSPERISQANISDRQKNHQTKPGKSAYRIQECKIVLVRVNGLYQTDSSSDDSNKTERQTYTGPTETLGDKRKQGRDIQKRNGTYNDRQCVVAIGPRITDVKPLCQTSQEDIDSITSIGVHGSNVESAVKTVSATESSEVKAEQKDINMSTPGGIQTSAEVISRVPQVIEVKPLCQSSQKDTDKNISDGMQTGAESAVLTEQCAQITEITKSEDINNSPSGGMYFDMGCAIETGSGLQITEVRSLCQLSQKGNESITPDQNVLHNNPEQLKGIARQNRTDSQDTIGYAIEESELPNIGNDDSQNRVSEANNRARDRDVMDANANEGEFNATSVDHNGAIFTEEPIEIKVKVEELLTPDVTLTLCEQQSNGSDTSSQITNTCSPNTTDIITQPPKELKDPRRSSHHQINRTSPFVPPSDFDNTQRDIRSLKGCGNVGPCSSPTPKKRQRVTKSAKRDFMAITEKYLRYLRGTGTPMETAGQRENEVSEPQTNVRHHKDHPDDRADTIINAETADDNSAEGQLGDDQNVKIHASIPKENVTKSANSSDNQKELITHPCVRTLENIQTESADSNNSTKSSGHKDREGVLTTDSGVRSQVEIIRSTDASSRAKIADKNNNREDPGITIPDSIRHDCVSASGNAETLGNENRQNMVKSDPDNNTDYNILNGFVDANSKVKPDPDDRIRDDNQNGNAATDKSTKASRNQENPDVYQTPHVGTQEDNRNDNVDAINNSNTTDYENREGVFKVDPDLRTHGAIYNITANVITNAEESEVFTRTRHISIKVESSLADDSTSAIDRSENDISVVLGTITFKQESGLGDSDTNSQGSVRRRGRPRRVFDRDSENNKESENEPTSTNRRENNKQIDVQHPKQPIRDKNTANHLGKRKHNKHQKDPVGVKKRRLNQPVIRDVRVVVERLEIPTDHRRNKPLWINNVRVRLPKITNDNMHDRQSSGGLLQSNSSNRPRAPDETAEVNRDRTKEQGTCTQHTPEYATPVTNARQSPDDSVKSNTNDEVSISKSHVTNETVAERTLGDSIQTGSRKRVDDNCSDIHHKSIECRSPQPCVTKSNISNTNSTSDCGDKDANACPFSASGDRLAGYRIPLVRNRSVKQRQELTASKGQSFIYPLPNNHHPVASKHRDVSSNKEIQSETGGRNDNTTIDASSEKVITTKENTLVDRIRCSAAAANIDGDIAFSVTTNTQSHNTATNIESHNTTAKADPRNHAANTDSRRDYQRKLLANVAVFVCAMCGKTFEHRKHLKRHQQRHKLGLDKQGPVTSSNVLTTGPNHNSSEHVNEHTCPECGKTFRKLDNLRKHLVRRKHDLSQQGNREENERHISEASSGATKQVTSYECPECDKTFQKRDCLRKHLLGHKQALDKPKNPQKSSGNDMESSVSSVTNKAQYECPVCGKIFQRQDHYEKHLHRHEQESGKCRNESADRGQDSEPSRQTAMLHNNAEPSAQSAMTQNTSEPSPQPAMTRIASEQSHQLASKHINSEPLAQSAMAPKTSKPSAQSVMTQTNSRDCPVCDKTFQSRDSMRRHLYRVHKQTIGGLQNRGITITCTTRYECFECGKTFKEREELRKHIHRQTQSLHKCSNQKENGQNSESPASSTERRTSHKCPECGKLFRARDDLSKHLICHNQDLGQRKIQTANDKQNTESSTSSTKSGTSYDCPECGKAFHQQEHLNKHLLRHRHKQACKEGPPYECPECGRRFPRRDTLKRHLRIHVARERRDLLENDAESPTSSTKGETLHKCPECGKTFQHRDNLKTHLRVHKQGLGDHDSQVEKFPQAPDSSSEEEISHDCPECGRTFLRRDSLKTHIKLVHKKAPAERRNRVKKHIEASLSVGGSNKEVSEHNNRIENDRQAPPPTAASTKQVGEHNNRVENDRGTPSSAAASTKQIGQYNSRVENDRGAPSSAAASTRQVGEYNSRVENDAHSTDKPTKQVRAAHVCPECGKTFSERVYLKKHRVRHTPVRHSCPKCSKSFRDPDYLKKHLLRHARGLYTQKVNSPSMNADKNGAGDVDKGKNATGKKKKPASVDKVNETEGPHKCPVCKNTYKAREYLARHLRLHGLRFQDLGMQKVNSNNTYGSRIYGKYVQDTAANDTETIPDKEAEDTTAEKIYKCNECDQTFIVAEYLKRHLRRHRKEKKLLERAAAAGENVEAVSDEIKKSKPLRAEGSRYTCDKCGTSFRMRHYYLKHRLKPTCKREFPCKECGKIFPENNAMERHYKSVHLGERPFKCTHCDKR